MRAITPEEEQQELRVLLASGIFTKAPNVQSFLEFVAGKYFNGSAEEVKEYQIAVEALHRSEDFNPQYDTIVRVTAHSLRKRLDQYYSTEGAEHLVHIQLPTGRYQLRFEHRDAEVPVESDVAPIDTDATPPALPGDTRGGITRWGWTAAAVAIALIVLAAFTYRTTPLGRALNLEHSAPRVAMESAPPAVVPASASGIRFLVGENRHPYTDPSGQVWAADQFCKGGSSLLPTDHRIQGTQEVELYRGGRKGTFKCRIPVSNGSYEVHLFFADTEGTQEAARQVVFTVNGGSAQTLDVVDLAGGNDIATGRVLACVPPLADGTIHIDFEGEGSFVNAVELLPAASNHMVPIRMHVGPVVFHDNSGNVWSPDRFFSGGRKAFHPDALVGAPDAALFQWERYGHFHYSIPVISSRQYTVTLYFTEAWFGEPNGAPGGVGSRVFDVYGDGTTLLSNFDIYEHQKNRIAKVTFHHVKPTSQDLIDLYFSPKTNYALVNAIEIEDES